MYTLQVPCMSVPKSRLVITKALKERNLLEGTKGKCMVGFPNIYKVIREFTRDEVTPRAKFTCIKYPPPELYFTPSHNG